MLECWVNCSDASLQQLHGIAHEALAKASFDPSGFPCQTMTNNHWSLPSFLMCWWVGFNCQIWQGSCWCAPLPRPAEVVRSALLSLAGEEGLERENPAGWPNQE